VLATQVSFTECDGRPCSNKRGAAVMPLVTRNQVTESSNATMTETSRDDFGIARDAGAAHQQDLANQQHHANDSDCGKRNDPESAGRLWSERRKVWDAALEPGIQPDIFDGNGAQNASEQPGEAER